MKKWLAIVLSLVMIFVLSGCGVQSGSDRSIDSSSTEQSSNSNSAEQPGSNAQQRPQTVANDAGPDNGLVNSNADGTEVSDESVSVVYMTTDISPEGLMAVYEALGWTPEGNVAVKLSTGEPPASNYLRPVLIADVVEAVNGTIVECNTAYGGSRAETAMHYQVAKDHGFTAIADFQILGFIFPKRHPG